MWFEVGLVEVVGVLNMQITDSPSLVATNGRDGLVRPGSDASNMHISRRGEPPAINGLNSEAITIWPVGELVAANRDLLTDGVSQVTQNNCPLADVRHGNTSARRRATRKQGREQWKDEERSAHTA